MFFLVGGKNEHPKKKISENCILFFSNGKKLGALFEIQQIKKCSPNECTKYDVLLGTH